MKRKIDKNKVYQFIGQAVVYTSGWALAVAFFYWAFLQRINLLILKERVEKEMLKVKKKENYEAMIENRNVLIADLQNKTKELLEDFVITINELQDIQAMKIKEEEKDKMRNSIINNKRTKYVTKLIELSNTRQSNR